MRARTFITAAVLAVAAALSLVVVESHTDRTQNQGQFTSRGEPDPPVRPKETREVQKLNTILENQERLLRRLRYFENGTLPDQLARMHNAFLEAIRANQAELIDAFGGLETQCSMPDVLPLPEPGFTGPAAFCRFEFPDTRLKVVLYNQAGQPTGPFTTRVTFVTYGNSPLEMAEQDVVGLAAFNGTATLFFEIPETCFPAPESECHFTISADVANVVFESDEVNNTVAGRCIRIG